MGKRVAIVQSNYIPWKGYFDLIDSVDEFVLYDDAQFTKGSWRNRNLIKTSQGLKWLTIPVHYKFAQKVREVDVCDFSWVRKHRTTIHQNYSSARYFGDYIDVFGSLYRHLSQTSLSNINHAFLKLICGILGITTHISWSMDYHLEGNPTQKLVGICQQAGATEYLSGPVAKCYLDEALFDREGIRVRWMDYGGYPEYRQLFPPFEHAVSIIDLIFNEGPDSRRFLKRFSSFSG